MIDPIRVLVVDDEPQITRVLQTILTASGYAVRTASGGESALAAFRAWPCHLLITDLAMPNMDGVELCRRLRAFSMVRILVLSVKAAESAKVEALDAGADDYLTKPFGADELLARVRAATRRLNSQETVGPPIELGDLRIDLQTRDVRMRGRRIHLTPKEFDLLVYLAKRPNRVITHRQLLEAIWGLSAADHPEYLRVFVAQLRKKLEPDPSTPRHLATEPWVGYRFNTSA
jgi:two-component system, OmpR family, KDP operon response regulator KdpE